MIAHKSDGLKLENKNSKEMAKQLINLGISANDNLGTTLRQGGLKINQNFTEVYTGTIFVGENPDTPESGYSILFPTSDGRLLLKNSDAITKMVQRHEIINSIDEVQPRKLGLKFSGHFEISEVGDNLVVGIKSDVMDGYVEVATFESAMTTAIETTRPDEDYKNPTSEETESTIQSLLDEEGYLKGNEIESLVETLRPDVDYKNPDTVTFESSVQTYLDEEGYVKESELQDYKNPSQAELHNIIDDRVASQGYVKELQVDAKIASAIPDIEGLTTHVDTELGSLTTSVQNMANDVTDLQVFQANIETEIDTRISNTVQSAINALDGRVDGLEDTINEIENLKGAIATVLASDPAYFRDVLNVAEK